MNKILHRGSSFVLLTKHVKKPNKVGKGHPIYIIEYHGWGLDEEAIRDSIAPNRSIGGAAAWRWKFRDLATAKKKWTMLMLRWGSE